jgi:hypothetical protein
MLQLDFTLWKGQVCSNYIVLNERLKYVTIIFTQRKTQVYYNKNLLSERLKYVTIRFYSEKGSSMWQVDFTLHKAQACDN